MRCAGTPLDRPRPCTGWGCSSRRYSGAMDYVFLPNRLSDDRRLSCFCCQAPSPHLLLVTPKIAQAPGQEDLGLCDEHARGLQANNILTTKELEQRCHGVNSSLVRPR